MEEGLEVGKRLRVYDISRFEPAAAGGDDAELHVVQVLRTMGVG